MSDTPNIDRIVNALQEGTLSTKYTESSIGIDLSEALLQFIMEEDFGDDGMEDEFADGRLEESFFIDWLKDEKEIDEETGNKIWNDLNAAFKGECDNNNNSDNEDSDSSNNDNNSHNSNIKQKTNNDIIAPEPRDDEQYNNYNIKVTDLQLSVIEEHLKVQCNDLRVKSESADASHDRATYSILQIGKQNHNQPLLMYLVDAYNRYRIQRRKRLRRRYPDPLVYSQKFKDPDPSKFIDSKCRGFNQWLSEYTDKQILEFKDMCQSSISVFFRRLLHKPPMVSRTAMIDDSIIAIALYIFQCYSFVEQFVNQNESPLPSQIDVVILPKKAKIVSWDSDEDEEEDDDDDEYSDDEKQSGSDIDWDIGDIAERIKSQKYKIGGIPIEWGTANRTMLQNTNSVLLNKRYQRAVVIIDRRKKYQSDDGKDVCYAYQPNPERKCNTFESDPGKFLCESLMQNSRLCLLPKLVDNKQEVVDIGINVQIPSCLTLSFHCFGINEIRVYLCYNGWGTRFYLEDIKYFLPEFFVKKEIDKLRKAFEKSRDRSFANKYEDCKKKCIDEKFEAFYEGLIDGRSPH